MNGSGYSSLSAAGFSFQVNILLLLPFFSLNAIVNENVNVIKMRTFRACGGVRTLPVHPPWLRAWYISTGSLEIAANYCTIDDINDYEMKELINKVDEASSDKELSLLATNASLVDGLCNAGWFHYLTMANKGLSM